MIFGVKKCGKNVAFRGERFRRPRTELVIVVVFMKWAEDVCFYKKFITAL